MVAVTSDTQMFFKIIVFFAIVTAVTSVFNLANSGDISIANFADPSGSMSGYFTYGSWYSEGANIAPGSVITNLDFTSISSINPNVTTLVGGPWTLSSGTGLVLTGLPILPGTLNPSVAVARNVRIDGQKYTFKAVVDNSNGNGDFYIFPRFIDGYSGSDLKVVFSSDGVHLKKFPLYLGVFDNGDDNFLSLPNAKSTIPGGSTIESYLTETVSSTISNTPEYSSKLTIKKDGVVIFNDINVRSILPGSNINDQVRHGGAGSDTQGFIIKSYLDTPMTDTSASIVSGSQGTSGSTDPLSSIGQFYSLVATALGFNPGASVPAWLWALIGVPCISTLIYLGVRITRGV